MSGYERTSLAALIIMGAVIVGSVTATSGVPAQDNSARGKRQKFDRSEFESQFPLTEYEAAEPSDPDKRARRKAVSKKYNNSVEPISENADTIFSAVDWEAGLPALPVAQSQMIIVGKVVDAHSYLSEDKTAVYSEFTISVGRTFYRRKPEIDTDNEISSFANLTAWTRKEVHSHEEITNAGFRSRGSSGLDRCRAPWRDALAQPRPAGRRRATTATSKKEAGAGITARRVSRARTWRSSLAGDTAALGEPTRTSRHAQADTHKPTRTSLYSGLGAATKVDKLEVRWPDGPTETFDVPAVGKTLTLTQG